MTFMRRVTQAAAILALAVVLAVPAGPAAADKREQARAFVEDIGNAAVAELSDPELSEEERTERFREILHDGFAIEAISRFVLGRYWRAASEEDRQEFVDVLERILMQRFLPLFDDFDEDGFEIVGARPDASNPDLIVVTTAIVDPVSGEEFQAGWRVRELNGEMQIVDVIAEGVSMAITFRSEYGSVIQRGGGEVRVLIDQLEEQLARGEFRPDEAGGLVE